MGAHDLSTRSLCFQKIQPRVEDGCEKATNKGSDASSASMLIVPPTMGSSCTVRSAEFPILLAQDQEVLEACLGSQNQLALLP